MKNELIQFNYRNDIDGIRAIAVMAVLLYHAFPQYVSGGYMGVDVFFVISGYLITSISLREKLNNNFKISQFYLRRVRRIFPALILTLFITVICGWLFLYPKEFLLLGQHVKSATIFISNFQLYSENGYFDQSSDLKSLTHLWSLGIEEQFYLLWPLLMVFMTNTRKTFNTIFGLVIISFVINVVKISSDSDFSFYMPYSRIWELGVGCLLAFLGSTNFKKTDELFPSQIRNNLYVVATLGIFFATILYFDSSDQFPGWLALIPVFCASVWIVLGEKTFVSINILTWSPITKLGLMSYPLYLWHWPVLVFALHYSSFDFFKTDLGRLLLVFFCLIISFVTTKWEKIFKLMNTWSAIFKWLIIPMISLGFIGVVMVGMNGLPQRYPNEIRSLFSMTDDHEAQSRQGICFLDSDQSYDKFHKVCGESTSNKKILLWGDSHAAHLYPGLLAWSQKENYSLLQYNASGCPPVISHQSKIRSHCSEVNNYIMNEVVKNNLPDVVVLAANWPMYYNNDWGKLSEKNFSKTISVLKSIGIKNIIIVGPVPTWKNSLIYDLVEYYQKFQILPFEMSYKINYGIFKYDNLIEDWTQKNGIQYISPVHFLCNKEHKCQTFAENNKNKPMSFDYGHLTVDASKYLITNLFSKIALSK